MPESGLFLETVLSALYPESFVWTEAEKMYGCHCHTANPPPPLHLIKSTHSSAGGKCLLRKEALKGISSYDVGSSGEVSAAGPIWLSSLLTSRGKCTVCAGNGAHWAQAVTSAVRSNHRDHFND
ncbi:hypothetical protein PAMP_006106 [Pampus punctatissimus]